MEKEKPRLARLTAIITQLQAKRLVTARQLADKHQVSIRTIYRDIKTLEQSGIPIVTEEGRGYRLLEGYQLPPIMFSEAEANALVTIEKLIEQQLDQSLAKEYASAITKIKSVLRDGQKVKTELLADRLLVRSYTKTDSHGEYLMTVQTAITNFQRLDLRYRSAAGIDSSRKIDPFALYRTQEHWILVAFCHLRQAFRAFRLSRILALHQTGISFEPHPMTLEEFLIASRKKVSPTPDIPLTKAPLNLLANQKHQIFCAMQTVKIESFFVVGIAVRTTKENNQAAQDIPALWNRFVGEGIAEQITSKLDPTVYGVYTDYEGDHTQPYTTLIGCRVPSLADIPEGMTGREIPGGTFQPYLAKGNLQQGAVFQVWNEIWQSDLARSYRADFEVYGAKALNPLDAEVEIMVGVD